MTDTKNNLKSLLQTIRLSQLTKVLMDGGQSVFKKSIKNAFQ